MLVYTWDSLYCSMLILYCPQIKSYINHKSGCVLARIWQYGAYHYTRVISMYGDTVGKAIYCNICRPINLTKDMKPGALLKCFHFKSTARRVKFVFIVNEVLSTTVTAEQRSTNKKRWGFFFAVFTRLSFYTVNINSCVFANLRRLILSDKNAFDNCLKTTWKRSASHHQFSLQA